MDKHSVVSHSIIQQHKRIIDIKKKVMNFKQFLSERSQVQKTNTELFHLALMPSKSIHVAADNNISSL